MKKIFLVGAFMLLCTSLFSCTSDDYEEVEKKVKTEKPSYADGPGDQTIPIPPPKKPD